MCTSTCAQGAAAAAGARAGAAAVGRRRQLARKRAPRQRRRGGGLGGGGRAAGPGAGRWRCPGGAGGCGARAQQGARGAWWSAGGHAMFWVYRVDPGHPDLGQCHLISGAARARRAGVALACAKGPTVRGGQPVSGHSAACLERLGGLSRA